MQSVLPKAEIALFLLPSPFSSSLLQVTGSQLAVSSGGTYGGSGGLDMFDSPEFSTSPRVTAMHCCHSPIPPIRNLRRAPRSLTGPRA